MSDLNQFTCTGRLGADPEVRRFPNGDPVVTLRVAVSDKWRDRETGEQKERSLWMPVKITNKGLCRVAESFLSKGSKVALSGQLQSRSWEKDGQKHGVTELVLGQFQSQLTMLDGPSGDNQRQSEGQMNRNQGSSDPQGGFGGPMNDEVPF